jgi:L-asparagine transporter-like permease
LADIIAFGVNLVIASSHHYHRRHLFRLSVARIAVVVFFITSCHQRRFRRSSHRRPHHRHHIFHHVMPSTSFSSLFSLYLAIPVLLLSPSLSPSLSSHLAISVFIITSRHPRL